MLLRPAKASVILTVLLLSLVSGSSFVAAQDDGRPKFIAARIGFDGHFKLGCWTAIEVTLRGGLRAETGIVTLTVPDGDGVAANYTSGRLALPPGQTVRTTLFVKPGRDFQELPAVFDSNDDRPIENRFYDSLPQSVYHKSLPWTSDKPCILCVGSSLGLAQGSDGNSAAAVVQLNDVSQLPSRWQGYEGVDTLVVSASRPDLLKPLRENSAQLKALEDWIELGGRLVLCVGAEAHAVLDPQQPLSRFSPGLLEEVVTLRQTGALESYSGTSYRVPLVGKSETGSLQIPRFRDPQGVVELREGDLPIVIRAPRRFGEVTLVGLDLEGRLLSGWQGRRALVQRVLSGKPEAPEAEDPNASAAPAVSAGYQDLAGQLRNALDSFTGVRVVPFWIVGGLVFVYILAIGPGDFFFVKKVLKRMELTWITFPATVVVVSIAALALAHWAKGDMLLVNQVDVVDVDTSSGQVRGTTWLNVFSPQTARYDVALAPQVLRGHESDPELLLSGMGLAGTAWGGMNSRPAGPQVFARAYDVAPALDALFRVPIDVWSTKGFNGRWQALSDDSTIDAEFTVQSDRTLAGSLTNHTTLELSDCFLAYDRWAWTIGPLQPGATAAVKLGSHHDLQSALRDFRVVENERNKGVMRQPVPYDVRSKDIAMIVRTMMFAEAANAADYTGLAGRYQEFIDLSPQLKLGRAILVGQSKSGQPATQLRLNGQPTSGPRDQHWVFYRFLLPVKP